MTGYNLDAFPPNLGGDVPRATSYGIYISQFVRFARASSELTDYHERNRIIKQKLLLQGFRYHELRKTFGNVFRRYGHLVNKYNTTLKHCLTHGISHPLFYGDVIYTVRKLIASSHFSVLFPKRIKKFSFRGYDLNILYRTACLVVDIRRVNHFADSFDWTMTKL